VEDIEFKAFDKIARLNREVIVTEKIDGTNGVIYIGDDFSTFRAGSRWRWVTPGDDNFGFAAWAEANREELIKGLGPGYHYGEWWGAGIQRRYGLSEKRFSLFNVSRWGDVVARPACCHVVPELARGLDIRETVERALATLRTGGSVAAQGFMKPEGVVAFHTASGMLFKVTLEKDEAPKGANKGA
jgi:hypothetical protein